MAKRIWRIKRIRYGKVRGVEVGKDTLRVSYGLYYHLTYKLFDGEAAWWKRCKDRPDIVGAVKVELT